MPPQTNGAAGPLLHSRSHRSSLTWEILRQPVVSGRESHGTAWKQTVACVVQQGLAWHSTCKTARAFFIPLALALALHALLRPLVRGLKRLHIPTPLGAAIIVLGAVAVGVTAAWSLSGPVVAWVEKAPANFASARAKLSNIVRPLDRLTDAAGGGQAPPPAPPRLAGAAARPPPLARLLWGAATPLL